MKKKTLIFVCRFFIILAIGVLLLRYVPMRVTIKSWHELLSYWPLVIFITLVATFIYGIVNLVYILYLCAVELKRINYGLS